MDPAEIEVGLCRSPATGCRSRNNADQRRPVAGERTRWRRTAPLSAALVGTNVPTGLAVAALPGGPSRSSDAAEAADTPTGLNIAAGTGAAPDARSASLMRESQQPTRRPPRRTPSSNSSGPRYATPVGDGSRDRTAKERNTAVAVTIYRRADPQGSTRHTAIEADVNSAYSTMMIRSDSTDRLFVVGSISTDGVDSPESLPICA